MGNVSLPAATLESLEVPIKTSSDPTGAVPRFSLSQSAATPGTYASGTWQGTYNTTSKYTTALTPLIGGAGTLQIVSGQRYVLWVEVTLGSEIAEWPVGSVLCP